MMLAISHGVPTDIRGIIVAEAGKRRNQNNTMNTNQFSLANRKQLAEVLGHQYDGPRRKAVRKFQEQREALEKSLIKEFAEKRGATKLVSQLEIAEKKCEDLRDDISKLDFALHSDMTLGVVSNSPLDKIIDDRIEKQLGTEGAIEARFDSAQIAMMTVASLEDADKLLKSVTTIQ